jgi:hypothetical protein
VSYKLWICKTLGFVKEEYFEYKKTEWDAHTEMCEGWLPIRERGWEEAHAPHNHAIYRALGAYSLNSGATEIDREVNIIKKTYWGYERVKKKIQEKRRWARISKRQRNNAKSFVNSGWSGIARERESIEVGEWKRVGSK